MHKIFKNSWHFFLVFRKYNLKHNISNLLIDVKIGKSAKFMIIILKNLRKWFFKFNAFDRYWIRDLFGAGCSIYSLQKDYEISLKEGESNPFMRHKSKIN